MKQIFAICLIYALLFSCSSNKETQALNSEGVDSLNLIGIGFVDMGDSLRLPPFEIEVTLDDTAERKLKSDHETIIVAAYLSGMPKDSTDVEVSESGELLLGAPQIELDKPGIARFDKINIAKKAYESLSDKDFEVLINIYSGRKSSELNLLDGEILQKPISGVCIKRHVLNAKLIGD